MRIKKQNRKSNLEIFEEIFSIIMMGIGLIVTISFIMFITVAFMLHILK